MSIYDASPENIALVQAEWQNFEKLFKSRRPTSELIPLITNICSLKPPSEILQRFFAQLSKGIREGNETWPVIVPKITTCFKNILTSSSVGTSHGSTPASSSADMGTATTSTLTTILSYLSKSDYISANQAIQPPKVLADPAICKAIASHENGFDFIETCLEIDPTPTPGLIAIAFQITPADKERDSLLDNLVKAMIEQGEFSEAYKAANAIVEESRRKKALEHIEKMESTAGSDDEAVIAPPSTPKARTPKHAPAGMTPMQADHQVRNIIEGSLTPDEKLMYLGFLALPNLEFQLSLAFQEYLFASQFENAAKAIALMSDTDKKRGFCQSLEEAQKRSSAAASSTTTSLSSSSSSSSAAPQPSSSSSATTSFPVSSMGPSGSSALSEIPPSEVLSIVEGTLDRATKVKLLSALGMGDVDVMLFFVFCNYVNLGQMDNANKVIGLFSKTETVRKARIALQTALKQSSGSPPEKTSSSASSSSSSGAMAGGASVMAGVGRPSKHTVKQDILNIIDDGAIDTDTKRMLILTMLDSTSSETPLIEILNNLCSHGDFKRARTVCALLNFENQCTYIEEIEKAEKAASSAKKTHF